MLEIIRRRFTISMAPHEGRWRRGIQRFVGIFNNLNPSTQHKLTDAVHVNLKYLDEVAGANVARRSQQTSRHAEQQRLALSPCTAWELHLVILARYELGAVTRGAPKAMRHGGGCVGRNCPGAAPHLPVQHLLELLHFALQLASVPQQCRLALLHARFQQGAELGDTQSIQV